MGRVKMAYELLEYKVTVVSLCVLALILRFRPRLDFWFFGH